MAYNLPSNWRSLLSQQAVTTGRPISASQASGLREGEIAAQYNLTGAAEDRALKQKAVDLQKEYQANQLALSREQMAMQEGQFGATEEERAREFGLTLEQQKRELDERQRQFDTSAAQQAERDKITKEAAEKQASASNLSGIAQLGLAVPLVYGAGKQAGFWGGKPVEGEKTWADTIKGWFTSGDQAITAPYDTPEFDYWNNADAFDFGSLVNFTDPYADFGADLTGLAGADAFDWGSLLFSDVGF